MELMVFVFKNRLVDIEGFSFLFGNNIIYNIFFVRNFGIYFDMLLIMEKYCNELFKLCYFYLRNIGCIRNYIIEDVCKMFVNVFVIFCLDYGNVLFVGINK